MEPAARIADAAEQLLTQGYAVFEGLYTDREVDLLRGAIAARYEALGSPVTYARPPLEPAPQVEISVVGLVFHQLGRHCPELAGVLLKEEVVATARRVLGENMHLEYTAAVVNHGARPFFPWHLHVGGVDNVIYRKRDRYPVFSRSERITTLTYLDDLDEGVGALLVYPRRVTDDTLPPGDPADPAWPGALELRCRRGTVVLLEQCTWHAARPKSTPGLRAFIASYFTAPFAAATSWVDRSFEPHAAPGSLLASVLPR